jgi:hypothetical protein
MPLPIPQLDDRRFADLVAEARQRLAAHNPEWTHVVPGDPADALIELFAWFAETILYRANLIPERQRRAFLRLLALPMRPARAARGVVCIDSAITKHAHLPAKVKKGARLDGGGVDLAVDGDLQPMPLELHVMAKRPLSQAELEKEGISTVELEELYGRAHRPLRPRPSRPITLVAGRDSLTLAGTLDGALHLALAVPEKAKVEAAKVRKAVAGEVLQIAVAPKVEGDVEEAETTPVTRRLRVEAAMVDEAGAFAWLPLDVESDSSQAGRRAGVLRVRLPARPEKFTPPLFGDPQDAGVGDGPPPLPDALAPELLCSWLRLTCVEDGALAFGWIGVNGVEVVAQVDVKNDVLGTGNGEPEQALRLARADADAASLVVEVESGAAWVRWERVDHFGGAGRDARLFVFDAESGVVRFGDGLRGSRLPKAARVRAHYRAGGGAEGNLPSGTIKALQEGGKNVKVRHEWALRGGVAAETVEQAERRIPAFLHHRDRAVTSDDYRALALDHPAVAVGRADVVRGLIPNASAALVREGVPGALSLFALPPAPLALGAVPRATPALLRDVFEYLRTRCPVGTELYVLSPKYRPIAVSVSVTVVDPTAETTTLQEIERALKRFLWPLVEGGPDAQGWPLGRAVDAAELATQVARVAGVQAVRGLVFFSREPTGWQQVSSGRLDLARWELPELAAVQAQTTLPPPPPRMTQEPDGDAPSGVPVPVVPERC